MQPSETQLETRDVRIIDRSRWGKGGPYPWIRLTRVLWVCPECGGPMNDDVKSVPFHEDGDMYSSDRWSSPCGHIPVYDNLKIAEYL